MINKKDELLYSNIHFCMVLGGGCDAGKSEIFSIEQWKRFPME